MEATVIAEIARNYAVMVRTQGPDPKGLKLRRHAFHHYQDGTTTLSASGFMLPESTMVALPALKRAREIGGFGARPGTVVLTAASVVECFMPVRQNADESLPQDQIMLPKLIPGARIDVLLHKGHKEGNTLDEPITSPSWLKAELLALINVPSATIALEQLVRQSGSPENGSWDIGWSLTPLNTVPASHSVDILEDEVQANVSKGILQKLTLTTRIAFLEISYESGMSPWDVKMPLPPKGASLLVIGSPFGILSPPHFFNSISVGTVANSCPSDDSHCPLLLADIRCLPGMEGSPVYDKCGQLVGMLTRPLRLKCSAVEIQLVITWDAIIIACKLQEKAVFTEIENRNLNHVQNAKSLNNEFAGEIAPYNLQSPLEAALSSVVLVAIGDGAWASGIILNNSGLVLTNAHLLEPWKYGKGSMFSIASKINSLPISFGRLIRQLEQSSDQEKKQNFEASMPKTSENTAIDDQFNFFQDSQYRPYKKLQVRLNHSKPLVWVDARVVYISKGPIDIALLQLEDIPQLLVPIDVDYTAPIPGSKVHVIGHGPFGPRSDGYPYISTGVLSRVVTGPSSLDAICQSKTQEGDGCLPIMIETTAAVYAGMSGGAVVNSDGRMIGLVTSNARHGGGVIIPEINFSLPCAVLEPIFKFSAEPNPAFLQVYNKPDAFLSSVWALRPPQILEPQPSPESMIRVVKGSRFAEFLAKRQAENPVPEDKEASIRGKLPRSKL